MVLLKVVVISNPRGESLRAGKPITAVQDFPRPRRGLGYSPCYRRITDEIENLLLPRSYRFDCQEEIMGLRYRSTLAFLVAACLVGSVASAEAGRYCKRSDVRGDASSHNRANFISNWT